METIRNRLIHHGASVNIRDDIVSLRLNQSFPYQSEVTDILKVLRQQVFLQRVKNVSASKSTRY